MSEILNFFCQCVYYGCRLSEGYIGAGRPAPDNCMSFSRWRRSNSQMRAISKAMGVRCTEVAGPGGVFDAAGVKQALDDIMLLDDTR